jgi:hypothetical protein
MLISTEAFMLLLILSEGLLKFLDGVALPGVQLKVAPSSARVLERVQAVPSCLLRKKAILKIFHRQQYLLPGDR